MTLPLRQRINKWFPAPRCHERWPEVFTPGGGARGAGKVVSGEKSQCSQGSSTSCRNSMRAPELHPLAPSDSPCFIRRADSILVSRREAISVKWLSIAPTSWQRGWDKCGGRLKKVIFYKIRVFSPDFRLDAGECKKLAEHERNVLPTSFWRRAHLGAHGESRSICQTSWFFR